MKITAILLLTFIVLACSFRIKTEQSALDRNQTKNIKNLYRISNLHKQKIIELSNQVDEQEKEIEALQGSS